MTSARVVFQCCTSAKLLLDESNLSEGVISKGLIAYIAFMTDCPDSVIKKMAETICYVHLIRDSNNKLNSVCESPCDLLLVPHFCLAGKLKGKDFQYHGAIAKTKAEILYDSLVCACGEVLKNSQTWSGSSSRFCHGKFGIRQILSMETNGPFTHIVDF